MDFLFENETLSLWLIHYGSFLIFVLLVLGIIALPVPEETLMVLSGVLMNKGSLNIFPTLIAAYSGSICGISLSYLLGRTAGSYLIHKYGGKIGLKEKYLQKVEDWFKRFGKWTLFIGYFIPGVRHFTGFSSGMTNLDFRQFALYAYSGAIVWVSTFLSIGYFFGGYGLSIFEELELGFNEFLLLGIFVLLCYLVYLLKKKPNRSA